jgi:hypothetical protein
MNICENMKQVKLFFALRTRAHELCSVSLKLTDLWEWRYAQCKKLLIPIHGILVPLAAFIIIIATTDVKRCFRLTQVGSRREK